MVVKMAGRGVDIVLGGSSGADRETVLDLGGLCVLGTERSGDRRTELHLRGRAGRQGDPGESVFYLSAEDEVTAQILKYTAKSLISDGKSLARLSSQLDKAQLNVAAAQAQWYTTNVALDDVLAEQQRVFYAERRTILQQQDLSAQVVSMLDEVLKAEVVSALQAGDRPEALILRLSKYFPAADYPHHILIAMTEPARDRGPAVLGAVRRDAREAYENREGQLGRDVMREFERRALLSVSDRAWRRHLAATSDLLAALVIRASGGTPSLPDYQREAARLYAQMTQQIREDVISSLFFSKIRLGRTAG